MATPKRLQQLWIGLFIRQVKELNDIAREKGVSRSFIMRVALDAWLNSPHGGRRYVPPTEVL